MSALEKTELTPRTKRASLHPVPAPKPSRAWPKASFPILILALLAAGMVGQLALQTKIQEQGFELAALQTEVDELSAQEAVLRAALDKQSTPIQLAYAASQLGMVANPYSNILILPTGEVVGSQKPVRGNEVPIISAPPKLPRSTTPEDTVDDARQPQSSDTQAGGQT